ncbi:MAG: M20 aminoacylase family protein [Betaproteobacteria bacterium]
MQKRAPPFVALRRDLHRHPELGLKEFRTSQLLAEHLESWGYNVTRGLASTGLVAQLRRGSGSKRLGLRADMDALPIHETNDFEYSSLHAGVMHACGHDGHTAMLMAAAQYIAQEVEFSGTLNLIFQPAEEHPGGAKIMIEDGLFELFPCDAIFAAHNMPGIAAGDLVFIEGPAMASSDDVTITLTGVGGHGAMPHKAQDPIVAAAAIVMTLQTIVSRNVDPQQSAVINVGSLIAGQANNVIPASAKLELSVRSLNREVRDLLQTRITSLVSAQAQSLGVSAHINYKRDYPVLVNSSAETELARQIGTELLGAKRITRQGRPLTGSEDFAFMLEHCPGSYFMIGNGSAEGPSAHACMVHNSGYDFNDNILPVGAAFWALLTQRYLKY